MNQKVIFICIRHKIQNHSGKQDNKQQIPVHTIIYLSKLPHPNQTITAKNFYHKCQMTNLLSTLTQN